MLYGTTRFASAELLMKGIPRAPLGMLWSDVSSKIHEAQSRQKVPQDQYVK